MRAVLGRQLHCRPGVAVQLPPQRRARRFLPWPPDFCCLDGLQCRLSNSFKETPMVHQQQFQLQTDGHRQMKNITDQVAQVVRRSGISTGVAQVFCVGSTGAIGAIEFEPGLVRDLPNARPAYSSQPGLRTRAGLARRQRPFTLAGHAAGPVAGGADSRRAACPGNVAAGLLPGVRHSPSATNDGRHCFGRMRVYLAASNANFADASRLPKPRMATRAANCSPRGRDLPASQL